MNPNKIDPNNKPTEVPPKNSKTELSEEELAKVTGGATRRSYEYQHGYGLDLTGKSVP
jgi:bacteriocin-like protein